MRSLRESRTLDPALECESPQTRGERLGRAVAALVRHAAARAPGFQRRLEAAGLLPEQFDSLEDLLRLPVLRKDALPGLQAADPPFGGLAAVPIGALARVFMSPGPIFDAQGDVDDFWRFRHALAAAGFRAGDVAHNSASYHLTPLGFMLDAAARSLGCVVVPAGIGQTELQVKVASHLRCTGYVGTPSFLYTLLGKARELGAPLAVEVAFVLAEMLPESLRRELEEDFGVRVLQGYGTADLGCLAYECPEKTGWHVHPECVLEVIDLESGKPAEPGQPGEVVATILDTCYPLVRLATGDLAAFAADERCPCGRTAPRIAGLLGRVGDGFKVKGMFVRGSQMDEVFKRFPEVLRWRAVITREHHRDELTYEVELASDVDASASRSKLASSLQEAVKVRGEVTVVPRDSIPAACKRVDDRRVWK